MSRFPKTEADIAALAMVLTDGLRKTPERFPAPPVPADELQPSLEAYNEARTAAVAMESAARDQVATKNATLEQLANNMRLDFKYAEITAKDAPEHLAKLGWGPRRDLGVKSQGDSWVVLDWKPPGDGGTAAVYHIERRRRDGGEWEQVAHAIATEDLLTGHEAGVEWEFRVCAENKAGVGERSTVVTVEL